MKTALIVDPDLGFGFWLARGLDQAGYQAFPSKSVADATALRDELRLEVDLLITNAAFAETPGWIETLRAAHGHLRVVALIGDQPRLAGLGARVDLCCRKPDRRDDVKRREWIEHVEELLPSSVFGAAFENSALLRKCAGALVWRGERTEPPSAPPLKEWAGRTIDGRFPLDRCIGGGDHSAVFATRHGSRGEAAAIKVVRAEAVDRHVLLPRWERAAGLSHPGLVRVFDIGSAESQGSALLYLVMEYAEENLAEVLRERALTAEETRELLEPVLDALGYVHGHGLVHGRVKPSNILAVSDRLKISSDGLFPAGERPVPSARRDLYDAPEASAGFISPAGDVWSLGITLVEALTQRPLVPKRQHKPPAIPVTLPPLFLDIARQCLQPDPQRRETIEHLADRLRHAPPVPEKPAATPRRSPWRLWPYSVPGIALGLALSGVLVRPHQAPTPVAVSVPAPPAPPAAPPPQPAPSLPQTATPATRPSAPPLTPPPGMASAPVQPPAVRRVSEQVLPDVSQNARDTVQGMLEVRVQVRVDPSGSVVDAKLDSPGPSPYFASRALNAAKRWKFTALPNTSQAALEDWMLRFDYTKTGAQASSARVTP